MVTGPTGWLGVAGADAATSAARASSLSELRATAPTAQPAPASWRTSSIPIPELAPTTSARPRMAPPGPGSSVEEGAEGSDMEGRVAGRKGEEG